MSAFRLIEAEKEFRRFQRYGAIQTLERFGSEEELFEFLYADR